MVIQSWSRLVRFPNLFLLALVQWTVYSFMIRPYADVYESAFGFSDFCILVFISSCVAASGFVLNNILDRFIDHHHAELRIIPQVFTLRFSWMLYFALVLSGFVMAFYLSQKTGRMGSLYMYPIAVILLWSYSAVLKCTPVLGNIFVSLFTSFGILIVPYAFGSMFRELRSQDPEIWLFMIYKLIMLTLFAFVLNLIRELIKDMQDLSQDQAENCQSTAVYYGMPHTKRIVLAFYAVLLILQCIVASQNVGWMQWLYFIILMAVPSLVLLYFFISSAREWPLELLSRILKAFMVSGLVFWCLIN